MSERIMVTQAGMDQLIDQLRDAVQHFTQLLEVLDQEVSTLRGRWTGEASDAYDRAQREWTAKLTALNELLAEHRHTTVRAQEIFQDARRKNEALWS